MTLNFLLSIDHKGSIFQESSFELPISGGILIDYLNGVNCDLCYLNLEMKIPSIIVYINKEILAN